MQLYTRNIRSTTQNCRVSACLWKEGTLWSTSLFFILIKCMCLFFQSSFKHFRFNFWILFRTIPYKPPSPYKTVVPSYTNLMNIFNDQLISNITKSSNMNYINFESFLMKWLKHKKQFPIITKEILECFYGVHAPVTNWTSLFISHELNEAQTSKNNHIFPLTKNWNVR